MTVTWVGWLLVGVAAWIAVAVAAGMAIGRALHLRDHPPFVPPTPRQRVTGE